MEIKMLSLQDMILVSFWNRTTEISLTPIWPLNYFGKNIRVLRNMISVLWLIGNLDKLSYAQSDLKKAWNLLRSGLSGAFSQGFLGLKIAV